MKNKTTLVLVAFLVLVLIWGLMSSGVSVTINGEEIEGPLKAVAGVWDLIITTVVLFCVAILLAFVFTGVGLIVMGAFLLVGLILLSVAFPFLLPLLIPLFIVWLFSAKNRRSRIAEANPSPEKTNAGDNSAPDPQR